MKSLKPILKSRHVHMLLVWLIAAYIRLVFITSRKEYEYAPDARAYMEGKGNAIFSFWHGRMMMLPCICPPNHPMHVLISQHRDGVFISDVMTKFHLTTIAGSTSKNGSAALRAILRALKEGDNISITPDGPRGPHQIAAPGIVAAAKLSGRPILPATFSATRHKRANSWDKYMLVFPFSRIKFCVGSPIMLEKTADDEEARQMVERAMNQLTEQVDAELL